MNIEMHPDTNSNAQTFDVYVSNVLRGGVFLASLCIAAGVVVLLLDPHSLFRSSPSDLSLINASFPHTPPSIISSALHGNGAGLTALGLVLLILTPVLRVLTSFILYLQQRDYRFAVVTATVLLLIVCGIILTDIHG